MIPKNAVTPENPVNLSKEAGENWYLCPRCRTKLFKLRPFAKAEGQEYTEEAMSRIEELLLCILNNEDTDMVPVSRNEEILIAKIKGQNYDKEPQSRIEELLIGWLSAIEGNIIDDQNRDIVTDENKKLYAR